MSVAHSFGICVPASIAARMIEVPSGTVTCLPSMVSVTTLSDVGRGVPKSVSSMSDMMCSFYSAACRRVGAGPKVFREMLQRAHHRIRRETAERAERAELHGVAEVVDQGEVLGDAFAAPDLRRWSRRRGSSRSGTACTCRSTRSRRTPWRSAPASPCRRCRRTRRCRRGRSGRRARQRPRSRTAYRTARAGNRRRADRRPAPRAPAGREAVPPPMSSTSSPSVTPNAVSNSPPCLMLPASWIGMVPRERPMPKSA